jgi:hypothetical protein
MNSLEQFPNPEPQSSVNPAFIDFLNEKVQENKAFEDMIASNYEAHEIPVATPHSEMEKSARKKSLSKKIGEGVFALMAIYTTAGQGIEDATRPAFELVAPVTVEASSSYADGDILAQDESKKSSPTEMLVGAIPALHSQDESNNSHPAEMPDEDLFDITRPVELKPAQARETHKGQWMKIRKKRLPRSLQKAASRQAHH